MRPNTNSFVAGFASCLIMVVIANALKPVIVAWWSKAKMGGGMGTIMIMLAIALGAWAMGRAQTDGGAGNGGTSNGSAGGSQGGSYAGTNAGPNPGAHSQSQSNGYARGGAAPPPQSGPPPTSHGGPPPTSRPGYDSYTESNSQWQAPPTPEPQPDPSSAPPPPDPKPQASTSSAWEKAREETRRKEEERKAREAEKKRREELDRKILEMRAKEAREREARDKKKKAEEAVAAAAEAKKMEERKKMLADAKARLAERKAAEAAKQADAQKAKEDAAKKTADDLEAKKAAGSPSKPAQSTYAFSSVGERMSPWPNGKPPSPSKAVPPPSPKKAPPPPSARTYVENEDDSYSYRPYDKPKRPAFDKAPSSVYSDSTYASQTTSKTTPPVSQRGPYSTQDPNKIQIKAVYAFTNAFVKTPASQLVSGVGSVTDGLILRITTEGLFIDDDVRGVPQREWDVKAWTMKLVEVWCPSFRQDSARTSTSATPSNKTFRRLWGLDKEKPATSEEVDGLLLDMLQLCKNDCRLRAANARLSSAHYDSRSYATSSVYSASSAASSDRDSVFSAADEKANKRAGQTGQNKDARLHVLRASIRDQEGKKYVFVITEEESWKISVGLQRLKKGSQVRALGVSGMSANDARSTLDNLGWK